MSAGGLGLLVKRRWGLILTALAGEAWVITSVGLLASHYSFMTDLPGPAGAPPLWLRWGWLVEFGGGLLALAVGILFLTVYQHPHWLALEARTTSAEKWLANLSLVVWGVISMAASCACARGYWQLPL